MELTTIWYILLCVLFIGYLILDGFDLGVGILHLFAKSDEERRVHINSIAPVWDGNEVWLITAGGALFAAFPPVYAAVASGLYIAVTLLLIALIMRAVSLEFRGKISSPAWKRTWDFGFGLGSLVAALLFGVAFANVLLGLPLDQNGVFQGGFFSLLSPFSLVFGLLGVSLLTLHGAAYLLIKSEGALYERINLSIRPLWLAVVVLFILVVFCGFFWLQDLYVSLSERYISALFLTLVFAGIISVPMALKAGHDRCVFYSTCLVIAALFALGASGLYPNFLISTISPAYSLTTHNASSTPLTLKTMLIITLLCLPVVLGYTVFIYRTFRGKVKLSEDSY